MIYDFAVGCNYSLPFINDYAKYSVNKSVLEACDVFFLSWELIIAKKNITWYFANNNII